MNIFDYLQAMRPRVGRQSLKGLNAGEKYIAEALMDLNQKEYRVFNNLVLPSHGKTDVSQIDHVVVSRYGIFCIETKGYKAWIFGKAKADNWTKTFRSGNKFSFHNPMMQNYGHVMAIESVLGDDCKPSSVFSLIAFPFAGKIKVEDASNLGDAHFIKARILSHHYPIYTPEQVARIITKLHDAAIHDKAVNKHHIEQIHDLAQHNEIRNAS